MPEINQEVVIWAGDTRKIRITVKNADGTATDLTGAAIKWWAGKTARATGADIYVQKSMGSGIALVGAATAGVFEVSLVPTDTKTIAAGRYYHEAEVTDGVGNVATVTTGPFIVQPSLIPSPP